MKLIIDAGHGFETIGKRAPDGMREYEFNRAAASMLREFLARCKADVYFAHSDARDVPLAERISLANRLNADFYLSIHANAAGTGSWHKAGGIETYVHTSKPQTALAAARTIQSGLVKASGLADRGVKTADFYVLRHTKCPAVLVECGFMTNRHEAALLQSASYRRMCAESIGKSIAAFFLLPAAEKNR